MALTLAKVLSAIWSKLLVTIPSASLAGPLRVASMRKVSFVEKAIATGADLRGLATSKVQSFGRHRTHRR